MSSSCLAVLHILSLGSGLYPQVCRVFKSRGYLHRFIQHDKTYYKISTDSCLVLQTFEKNNPVYLSRLSSARGLGDLYCNACSIAISPHELLTEFFWASIWQKGIDEADRRDSFIAPMEDHYKEYD